MKVHRSAAIAGACLCALMLTSCAHGGEATGAGKASAAVVVPERIVSAPRGLLAAAAPQPDGSMWALAGASSAGLFELETGSLRWTSSLSVSGAARSVAQDSAGVVGLAISSGQSGALELLSGRALHRQHTVPLAGPAADVVDAGPGVFDVLVATAAAASVAEVTAAGQVRHILPAPSDTVSVAPGPAGSAYVLQRTGMIDLISPQGKITSTFGVGSDGLSMAESPDGSTLFVLKSAGAAANVAVVTLATQSVHRVLPAARHCRQLLVSASGRQLFEVVGTARYGNIQIFAV